jgi:hypothetical protein
MSGGGSSKGGVQAKPRPRGGSEPTPPYRTGRPIKQDGKADKDIYDRLVAEWQAWNASILPEIAESFTPAFAGEELADHYGLRQASGA